LKELKLAILFGFGLMFFAGLTVGRWNKAAAPAHENRPWLSQQLNLSKLQEQQMKKIWSEAASAQSAARQLHDADRQRDEAVRSMLSDDQRAQLESIIQEHDARIGTVQKDREKAIRDAEDRTRTILSDEQRKKFDEISKAHGHRRGNPMLRFGSKVHDN
jgi:hypothetical protein